MTVAALIQLLFAALVVITGLDWLRYRNRFLHAPVEVDVAGLSERALT